MRTKRVIIPISFMLSGVITNRLKWESDLNQELTTQNLKLWFG